MVAILTSDEIAFRAKAIKKDKEGPSIMIKGSRKEEDVACINIHTPNTGTPKYIKQILTDIKGEIDNNSRRI